MSMGGILESVPQPAQLHASLVHNKITSQWILFVDRKATLPGRILEDDVLFGQNESNYPPFFEPLFLLARKVKL